MPTEIAEAWWRNQGRKVPDKITQADWVKMFERWLLYEWWPRVKNKNFDNIRERIR